MRNVFIDGDCNSRTFISYARRFVADCLNNHDYETKYRTLDEYIEALEKARELVDIYYDKEKEKDGWKTLVDDAPPEAWEALRLTLYASFIRAHGLEE